MAEAVDVGGVEEGDPAVEDLRLQVSRVAKLFTDPSFAKPFVGLLAASQHDEALASALQEWLITSRRAGASEVLRRGVERGELRADLDIPIAIDALYGALYYRLLVSHEPLSPEYGQRVVAELFTGLQSPRNSLSTGASTSAGTT